MQHIALMKKVYARSAAIASQAPAAGNRTQVDGTSPFGRVLNATLAAQTTADNRGAQSMVTHAGPARQTRA